VAATKTIPGGKFIPLVAINPTSVCCPEALLATALRSVGVPLHEAIPFKVTQEGDVTAWHWLFADSSTCGTYKTADLIKWWNSPEWLAANPKHEWAVVHRILSNHATCAREIRETVPRIIVRRGSQNFAEIPATATPEYRDHIIGQLEGRISANTPFTGKRNQ
jgi:hypothetical protein